MLSPLEGSNTMKCREGFELKFSLNACENFSENSLKFERILIAFCHKEQKRNASFWTKTSKPEIGWSTDKEFTTFSQAKETSFYFCWAEFCWGKYGIPFLFLSFVTSGLYGKN